MKTRFLIVLSLTFLCSCDGDLSIAPDETIPNILHAAIVNSAETKTTLSPETDGTAKVYWSEDDAIAVFMDDNPLAAFTLIDGAGTDMATFSGHGIGDKYKAYYPADQVSYKDGNDILVTFPEEQTGRAGSFWNGSAPMAACGNASSLSFYNLSSLLKISMTGHHCVTSIEFSPNDSSVKVSGPATVSFDEQGLPFLKISSQGGSHLIQHLGGVQLRSEVATDFYLVLPPQDYPGGFTVRINTTTGYQEKRLNADFTLDRARIHAATEFSVKLDEGIEPSATLQGKGIKDDPFLIQSIPDLLLMQGAVTSDSGMIRSASGTNAAAATAYYRLENDIDLSPICGESIGKNWSPIGNGQFPFMGEFDGNGHKIANLYIDNPSGTYQGFFGCINAYSKTIINLSIEGYINASDYVGLLAGDGYARFENCRTTGHVIAITRYYSYSGGLTGYGSRLIGCINEADVEGHYWTGGLAGCGGIFQKCVNYGQVVAAGINVGGIAGYASSVVNDCTNYGSITASYYTSSDRVEGVGGICGLCRGLVYNCQNQGAVTGPTHVGGILGMASAGSRCFNNTNYGSISGEEGYIGGICGETAVTEERPTILSNCVNVGKVQVTSIGGTAHFTGGICGCNTASVSQCYWLYDPDGQQGIEKGIGIDEGTTTGVFPMTEAQLKGAPYASTLYDATNGKACTTLLDALNAWAYDNTTKSYDYYGWHYPAANSWPALTGETATHP